MTGTPAPRRAAVVAAVVLILSGVGSGQARDAGPAVFGPAVVYPWGGYGPPHAMIVADVDRDGRPDLAALTCETNVACATVSVLLGNGDGSFRGPLTFPSGGNGGSALAAADVTRDGRIDLLVAHFASDTIGVLAGRGDGTFEPAVAYRSVSADAAAAGPTSVATADLDGDRVLDIVVTHSQSQSDAARAVSVMYGSVDGRFSAPIALQSGGVSARTVSVADLNGDRAPDLVVGNDWASFADTTHGTVGVLLNDGKGRFGPATAYAAGGVGVAGSAVADLDSDGTPDVVVAIGRPKSVSVLRGRGDGRLSAGRTFAVGGIDLNVETRAGSVAIADVNGDGALDVLAGTCFSESCAGSLFVLAGRGHGDFEPAKAYDTGGVGAGLLAVADLDGDAAADAVAATCTDWQCSSGSAAVMLRPGGGRVDAAAEPAGGSSQRLGTASMALTAPIAGAAVQNLEIVSDASPDLTDLDRLMFSTTSRWPTAAEKVWALFYWSHLLRRQTSPIVLHGFEITDPIRNFTDFGFAMCSTATGINQVLYEKLGLRHEYWDICNHTVANVEYDGRFHMVDNSMSNLVTLDDGVTLASVEEAAADSARLVRLHSLYATSPNGFLTGSDTMRNLVDTTNPVDGTTLKGFSNAFCAAGLKKRDYYYNWNAGHRYVLNLRQDESYTRYYRRLGTTSEYWIGSEEVANPDPAKTFQNDSSNKFGLHGNGAWSFTPALTADAYERALYSSANIAPALAGGLQPAAPAVPGDAIYKVQAANVIASQKIQALFARTDPAAAATIALSLNHGATWVDIGTVGAAVGPAVPVAVNLRNEVNGAYETLLRVRMTTTSQAPDGVRLTGLTIDTVTHVNARALPALNVGRNEIHVGTGTQADTMVLWPDLRGTLWQRDAFDSQNIASQGVSVPRKYTAVVYPSALSKDAYLTYRFDAPTDVTQVTYGGRLYNANTGSYIDLLHSFDGGATWTRSYRLDTVDKPYDVIHYETVAAPPGVRTVLVKYLIHNTATTASRASGLYAIRMEVNHQPAGGASAPVDVTWSWKEVQADRTTVARSHTQRIDTYPTRYVIDVGGSDHPVMESLKVSVSGGGGTYGYSDGVDVGGDRFLPSKRWEGTNLAQNKAYTFSPAPTTFQGSAGPTDTGLLTDGVVGAPQSGSFAYWWGQCWKANQNVVLQVDLGQAQTVGAVRAHLFGYPNWDALKGQVQDRIEIQTSTDGVTYATQGLLSTSLWRKDVPVNYMLLDDGTATGWNFELRLASPVTARYVRYLLTPRRSYLCASELQVFDRIDDTPFDLRIALPAMAGDPPVNQAPAVAMSSPATGTTVTAPAMIQLAANATDADGTVTHVEFLVDGTVVGDDGGAPWEATWDAATAGTYSLSARAYDNAGDSHVSSPVFVTVQASPSPGANVPPSVTVSSPAAGAAFTAGETLTIAADASDSDGTVTHVEFLVDGVVVADDAGAPWSVGWDAGATGTHALTARAYDDGGAVTTSPPVSITVQAPVVAGEDVVVWAAESLVASGWALTPDATAAGGARLQSPDLGVPKITTPLASPGQYFELTFQAIAGRGYRLWVRGKAQGNAYQNDSAYVQFDHSVDQAGAPVYRIGTTSATTYSVEDCSGCGVSGWGWSDNGYAENGPLVYFDTTGLQRLRVQVREDGLGVDQVVLSSSRWLTQAPGAKKNDTVVLPKTDSQTAGGPPPTVNQAPTVALTSPSAGSTFTTATAVALAANASDSDGTVTHVEFLVDGVVVADDAGAPWSAGWNASATGTHVLTARAYDDGGAVTTSAPVSITVQAPVVAGEDVVVWAAESLVVSGWALTPDATAAGGARLQSPDLGVPKITTPLASPSQYFELTFEAIAGRGYRLWVRGKAQGNAYQNDSAYVQFDHSVDQAGAPVYRIGTTSATTYSVEDCTGCGVSGWGWSDNGYAENGPLIYFDTTGLQRLRVQVREDGLGIDQIVLSSIRWLTQAPGAKKNDTVVLPKTDSQ